MNNVRCRVPSPVRPMMTVACMLFATGLFATVAAAGSALAVKAPAAESRAIHDIHLSFTRITVDGATIVCRVRLFTSDLQRAFGRLVGRDSVLVTSAVDVDSLFTIYFARRFPLLADGVELQPRVTASGEEPDTGGEPMRWYVVELAAPGRIHALSLRAGLLFELFDDQRNVVQVVDAATDRRTSFYFAAGDSGSKSVRF